VFDAKDIGQSDTLEREKVLIYDQALMKNGPKLWKKAFPRPCADTHKYKRGVAVIMAAPKLTGATRLAAEACARMGAGLVNVLSPPEIMSVYQAALPPHILVRDLEWSDLRITARLYGPGGLTPGVKIRVDRRCVLDAEAIMARPEQLNENVVLTPHEGEFARAFPDLQGSREVRSLAAAKATGAVIVLKGVKTVIAHSDGRMAINDHASPYLATAGTGDVLAGMITGLMAQGMEGFEAACAAVWLHGEASLKFGPGLVASDLIDLIPAALKEVLGKS
jgi:NAD(P)H-hydrate repair Nnr-like enzyme with NAD(P)H-hydrate dehydratase domain